MNSIVVSASVCLLCNTTCLAYKLVCTTILYFDYSHVVYQNKFIDAKCQDLVCLHNLITVDVNVNTKQIRINL